MRPKVFVLAKENFLSQALADALRQKGCEVLHNKRSSRLTASDYLIVVNTSGEYVHDKALLNHLQRQPPKTVIINNAEGSGFSVDGAVTQIFVDTVLGGLEGPLSSVVSLSARGYMPKEAWVSITTSSDLAEKVCRELFSFPRAKRILYGKLMPYREILDLLGVPDVFVDANANLRMPRKDLLIEEANVSGDEIKKAILAIRTQQSAGTKPLVRPSGKPFSLEIKSISIPSRKISFALLNLAVILFLPYLLLSVAGASAASSYKLFKAGNFSLARRMLSVSTGASLVTERMFYFYSIIPGIGSAYAGSGEAAEVLSRGTRIAGRVLSATSQASEFSDGLFDGGVDIETLSQNLYTELMVLYQELSFIDGMTRGKELPVVWSMAQLESTSEYRQYVLTAAKIAKNLPEILGYDRPKTYLLLFQNNMELRPTGGFIGSFSLLTFSKGQLIDDTVYDVYSADGQIKGYVSPPGPIEEHLGEAAWSLRDSNWDPDFPTSAFRAEWFLDKTLDRSVDGVIGVNLEVAKRYLEVVGEISLPDFSDNINAKNMYEKVQFEVEDGFFPGSRKKAHYLSALSDALVERIRSADSTLFQALLLSTVESLNARDMQVYFHDEESSDALRAQGWDGGIYFAKCKSLNCEYLNSGLVEANLGVNKANYFVRREVSYEVSVGEERVEHKLTLALTNIASGSRPPEERYKAYVRALAARDAVYGASRINSPEEAVPVMADIAVFDDRIEYGVLVDVYPGEKKEVVFMWSTPAALDFQKTGEVVASFWKQSGVGEYPFSVSLQVPADGVKISPPFRLTGKSMYGYNTSLSRDFKATVDWRQK